MKNIVSSVWDIKHRDRSGAVLWRGTAKNTRFDEGNRLGLEVFYRGSEVVAPTGLYLRLFNDTPDKLDTLGTIASEAVGNEVTGIIAETFNIVVGANDALLIKVDGGSAQTVTLTPNATATAADIAADINGAVAGVTASTASGGKVKIVSAATNGSIEFMAVVNDAYADLGFTVGMSLNGYEAQLIESSSVGWPTLERTIPAEESDTAQAGSSNTITLAAGANAADDFYVFSTIGITSGTGAGQSREAVDYDGTTKVLTVDKDWTVAPDNTSVYTVYSDYVLTSRTVTFTATGGPWGPVTHAVLADVATGIVGTAILFFPLTSARTLGDGESLDVSGKVKCGGLN